MEEIEITGLTSGFSRLDEIIRGLNKQDLIVIASRPGMGKTSLALNIALNAALQSEKKVAYFSLEMSREQLELKLLSVATLFPADRIKRNKLSDAERSLVDKAKKIIDESGLIIYDNLSMTVVEMLTECEKNDNIGLVIVDYLQLVPAASTGWVAKGRSRSRVLSEISSKLREMAEKLNIPVIVTSQLNRECEARKGGDLRPRLNNFRGFGSIEHDADIIIALYRDYYYYGFMDSDEYDEHDAELIVLKNKRGDTGTIKLRWESRCTRFYQEGELHTVFYEMKTGNNRN